MSSLPVQRSLAERAVEALGRISVLSGVNGALVATPQDAPVAAPLAKTSLPPAGPSQGNAPPFKPASGNGVDTPSEASVEQLAPAPSQPRITRSMIFAAGGNSMDGSRSRCSEELMVIQQQVLRVIHGSTPDAGRSARMVLITSARPREGKSFTALNLAAAIARSGTMPALLADADGKPGNLSELFRCSSATGLRALSTTPGMPVTSLVVPTDVDGLSFLPYGAPPADMAAPPAGNAVALALRRVAKAYPGHAVIIDTPPILSTSDASTLSAVVGQILLVVRAETTQRSEVEASLDMLEACPTLQLVLNQARVSASDSFGAYGYEMYGSDTRH